MKRALVIGCGLSGAVIARELAEREYNVIVLERRSHIGGNMYDHVDEHGIRVHDYGPHTFHTKKKELFDYICCYSVWDDYKLTCGAEINGICTPTPFNFQTIDDFYDKQRAERIKKAIKEEFPGKETATVVEALESENTFIHEYAQFLFDNDYSLYSAKQWGVSPSEIDSSILRRVPLRFNYDVGYFEDEYQAMPHDGYVAFFNRLLDHGNISVELNVDALQRIRIVENKIVYDGKIIDYPVIYTGPLDELFEHQYGELPYRSLRFKWVYENIDSKQNMPVVAYPQAPDFVRIIEYKKLPFQNVKGTTYEIEYSLPYMPGTKNEPYYPLLTDESQKLYGKYLKLLQLIPNIYVCGRLGDFKYYNMDQALERALTVCNEIINRERM